MSRDSQASEIIRPEENGERQSDLVELQTSPTPTAMPNPSREKSSSATATVQETVQDHIRQIEPNEAETLTVSSTVDQDKALPSAKQDNIRVHVSRQSTETTKDSKMTKRRFTIRRQNSDGLAPVIHWYTPTMMILLGLAGLFGALGHHLYNARLDGQPVGTDTQWPQRWGVAMAFFVKMTLVGAVQMAVKQRAWLTVKKRGFRVKTLDSIFHSCYDPAEFFDRELFAGAFFPALLSLLVWILPLSAIASPSTLTTGNGMETQGKTCSSVSTLDFFLENGFGIDKRDPTVNKQGMSFWDDLGNDTDHIYYFNQPSMDSRRNFQLSLLSSEPLQPQNPCPTDSNCTFSVSFAAPAYKCEPREDFGGLRTYNLSQMAPQGDLLFASYSSFEEDFVGRPLNWNRTVPNKDTGVFQQEPTLWVGWVWNTSIPATAENATQWNTSYWQHQLRTHIMECTLWNSTYSYTLEYLQGKMNVSDKEVRHDTVLLPPGEAMVPGSPTYMEFAGFHGTGWLYRTMLEGNISQKGEADWVTTESDISQTNIIDPGSGLPYEEDLAPGIEAAFHNIYLSFLSDDKQKAQQYRDLPCAATSHVLVWNYRPTWLAVSYFIAIGLTFAAIGVGLHAIATNGYVAQTNFSTFLATTRNPDLDKMAEGSCLGAWPIKKEMHNTRLRFGQTTATESGDRPPHAAFGFEDRVTAIEKGKQYS